MDKRLNQCERLRLIMEENSLKQKDLAEAMGISNSYTSQLLNKPYVRLSPPKAILLEKKYGYNADWILNGNEPKMISEDQLTSKEMQRIIISQLNTLNNSQIESVWAFIQLLNNNKN
ncbi:MAG: helix-turn-helix domain-containing protein [Christensenellales bacterium]|jgi:transcriptional regulator with XRE-family HTH domain